MKLFSRIFLATLLLTISAPLLAEPVALTPESKTAADTSYVTGFDAKKPSEKIAVIEALQALAVKDSATPQEKLQVLYACHVLKIDETLLTVDSSSSPAKYSAEEGEIGAKIETAKPTLAATLSALQAQLSPKPAKWSPLKKWCIIGLCTAATLLTFGVLCKYTGLGAWLCKIGWIGSLVAGFTSKNSRASAPASALKLAAPVAQPTPIPVATPVVVAPAPAPALVPVAPVVAPAPTPVPVLAQPTPAVTPAPAAPAPALELVAPAPTLAPAPAPAPVATPAVVAPVAPVAPAVN